MYPVQPLILVLLSCISLTSYAQNNLENDLAGVFQFEEETINYGTINQNDNGIRVFKFKNTGKSPIVISKIKTSCGCTVPTYSKEPILPGESAQIEVRYDTKRMGPFTKRVTLTTNAVNNSENKPKGTFELKIKGKVNPKAPEPEGVPASGNGFGSNN